jgi:molybdopterin/thiamine biosynthesis adenylyltransferase
VPSKKSQNQNFDDIDMSYAEEQIDSSKKIDVQSDQVKDRWSRYIGAMGIEAVAKQAESRVLICELGALGVEIAKNVVLAGCKEFVIFEEPDKPDVEFDRACG